MGQQWAATTAAAHPNTDTAQQQAALALPSAIVLEAVRTRPRAQAGEARRTQGLLTRGACSRDGVNGLVWFSVLLFPDILKIIPVTRPTASGTAPHLHGPICPPRKGAMTLQSTTPTPTLSGPSCLVRSSTVQCPESCFLTNPHRKSFLLLLHNK